jgi:hypothetical protein
MLGRHGVFIEKLCLKKISKKKNSIIFFSFFWLSVFRSQFGACLPKFGLSRPAGLGGDRDCTNSTKGLSLDLNFPHFFCQFGLKMFGRQQWQLLHVEKD